MDNQRTPRSYTTGTVKRDNRQQQQKMVVIMICIVIALLLVVFMTIIGTKLVLALKGGHNNANPSDVQYKDVTMDKTHSQYGPLALVNDTHEYKFPGAATNNLTKVWDYRSTHTDAGKKPAYKSNMDILLDGAALASMHKWFSDFHKDTGLEDLFVKYAYRPSDAEGFSTPIGKSDLHTGYAIILKTFRDDIQDEIINNPAYYEWLVANAYRYGFVQRYPEGKESITGVSNYQECFHYVGDGPAMYMHQNDLCLEEFIAQIKAYTHSNPLEVRDANGQEWLIYYTACEGDMATVKLPTNFTYTVSGDNDGGIIVCVSLSKTAYEQQQQESESETAQ